MSRGQQPLRNLIHLATGVAAIGVLLMPGRVVPGAVLVVGIAVGVLAAIMGAADVDPFILGLTQTVGAGLELEVAALFLIAPAFYMPGYEALTPTPAAPHIVIVHGWGDEVVPAANSIRWAQAHGAELHLIRGDHRLADRLTAINRLFDGFLQDVAAAT